MKNQAIQQRRSEATSITYFTYFPRRVTESTPLFVTVHGWSRNAEEHATKFLPYAESYGVVLVAPLFEAASSPGYQRLVSDRKHVRADRILEALVEEVGKLSGVGTSVFRLFGFSGGGQFAQRYTMAHPERVARLALGAPGWYTLPDPAQRFPLGIGSITLLPDISFEAWQFLKIPTRVFVGERDTRQSHHLNTSRSINRLQGMNRLERAERWIKSMTAAARACRLSTEYSLELLPDSNHSFRRCMEQGGMGRAVFRFLFGTPPVDASGGDVRSADLRHPSEAE